MVVQQGAKHALKLSEEQSRQYQALTVPALLAQQAEQYGDKAFLLFPEREEQVTYRQLAERCTQVAAQLQQWGLAPGDKVALLLPNVPEFLSWYWGTMSAGMVAGPINTLLKGPEIEYIAHHCNAKVLVTTPEYWGEVAPILNDLPQVQQVVLVADGEAPQDKAPAEYTLPEAMIERSVALHWYHSLLGSAVDPSSLKESPQPSPTSDAMIIYTSGTTGKPKGVCLTHQNLVMDAAYIKHWFGLSDATRMMCILPLFHVNGEVVTMMTPLLCGGSVVLNRKFSAQTFWEYLHTYEVQLFSTVPTILSILLAKQNRLPEHSCPQLQFGICGAAPLPVEVHKQFEETFGVPIYEGYGLSETTCYSTFNPPHPDQRKIGSIGVAVGNEVAIWDEHNQPVPTGEGGEIVARGLNVMNRYYQNPEATEKAFQGGWFHSGDWGKVDEDGFFYILDRVKDMIIRGGENIYPREIDEVLYEHPAIADAATIGIPDDKYGEEVKSYVVLKPGASATEEELLAYCKARLADFKCPKYVAFIPEIPKGPTGKLLRRALRELEQ